ncbi:MAG: 4-alpha-glucanotransferase, partial [Oscillospiraceae bacterium]|nr:4-alpha-glucanotransferase [Candidatus Equicaccousia limihippi]
QWFKLKEYANKKGVLIFGDLPFYVAPDSADVLYNRQSFMLKNDGTPRMVAGCRRAARLLCRRRTVMGQPGLRLGIS